MAGGRQAAFIATLLSGLMAASFALAQSVPLPQPAPKDRGATPAPAPAAPRPAAPATAAAPAPAPAPPSGLSSLLPPIFGGASPASTGSTTAFDPKQRALVDKVSSYLSSVQVLSGDFVQLGPDGRQIKGTFYLQKPGRVRFEYNAPSPVEIIADGQSVVVRDRKLATQDVYPLSQTPLRFLLSDRIDLLRETNIVGVFADDAFVSVVVEERQALIGTSRLMMMFGAKDLALKQWTITDAQGYDTTVAVSNLDTPRKLDPNLFRIDYTRYVQ